MPLPKPRLYTASKITHHIKWRNLREAWSERVTFSSRWIDTAHLENGVTPGPDSANLFMRCWIADKRDVLSSDFLFVYAEENDRLRGGLVEAGMAIGAGIPVFVYKDHEDYGSWRYHPLVARVESLEDLYYGLTGAEQW